MEEPTPQSIIGRSLTEFLKEVKQINAEISKTEADDKNNIPKKDE